MKANLMLNHALFGCGMLRVKTAWHRLVLRTPTKHKITIISALLVSTFAAAKMMHRFPRSFQRLPSAVVELK
jgi:hypothetical protein